MAVYEGARPRPILGSRRPVVADRPLVRRRRLPGAIRARRRRARAGLILGGIVLAFLVGFFSLAQTMQVSATGYEIGRLTEDGQQLEAELRQLASDLNRLGREPAIRKQAIDLGLGALGEPIVVPAR